MRFDPRQHRSPGKRTRRLRVLFEPGVGGILVGEDLEVVDVTDFLA